MQQLPSRSARTISTAALRDLGRAPHRGGLLARGRARYPERRSAPTGSPEFAVRLFPMEATPVFPSTCWSRLIARDSGPRRPDLETLAQAYWRPVHAWLRLNLRGS